MIISERALNVIKGNNRLIGRLMIAFNRSQNTIENWMAAKDVRLTTPIAVQIIAQESGLQDAEILVEDSLRHKH